MFSRSWGSQTIRHSRTSSMEFPAYVEAARTHFCMIFQLMKLPRKWTGSFEKHARLHIHVILNDPVYCITTTPGLYVSGGGSGLRGLEI